MKNVLIFVIIVFFILMILFMLVAVVSGIFYCIYQKTNKKYFNVFLCCTLEKLYFTLKYKNEKIDDIFVYGKYKGKYYFVGVNGIYRLEKSHVNKIQKDMLNADENDFVCSMIKECADDMRNKKITIDSFISNYNC